MRWSLLILLVCNTAFADEANTLRRHAHALEQQGDWAHANADYIKLEKFSKAEAFYGEAYASFQTNDNAAAITLSFRAKELPGAYQDRATLLYGDALFRDHQFERAKATYADFAKTAKGYNKAIAEKKVRACDKALERKN